MTDHEFKAPTRPTCHGEGELDAAAEWLAEIRARTLDAEFIAHARSDVPWLLAEVERLTDELDRVQGLADRLHEERLAVLAGVSKVVRRTTAADLYASLAGPSRGEQPEAGGE